MLKTFVRQARADDLEILEAIENEADALFVSVFSIAGWRPAPSYAKPSQENGFILVASDTLGSDAIGFAHVLEVPGGGHLEQLSVRPSAARRGHGRALVEAVKSESRLRGYERVTLRTFAHVPWNAPFYLSCGFIERDPDSDFLRDLLLAEQQQGLGYGRRVQMNFDLTDGCIDSRFG
ncbi:GNAT family N-acetyltransferase [Mycetocola zhujimingii]|uniref:GNAT family N-acetyltransferase n=1 Tax=Mycetocola zhujimingii TaxID=2079792 RepID=A0A2U1TEH5_9MICO|nr:GNAT family N-acetyltransferase [Mycetocola zhujimingii]PWC07173.1 GNAT family N-acetyltransferase [Mycetocola zhujimingii]